jgi:cupin fold WbuC family metalloprotein
MINVKRSEIDDLIQRSRNSKRRRDVISTHKPEKIGISAILNCIQQDSYIQPHLHKKPNGHEIWIPHQGKFGILLFDEDGKVTEKIILSSEEVNFFEIPPNTYHSAVSLEDDSIIFEFSEGPYIASEHKSFPDWAPKEYSDGSKEYLEWMKSFF